MAAGPGRKGFITLIKHSVIGVVGGTILLSVVLAACNPYGREGYGFVFWGEGTGPDDGPSVCHAVKGSVEFGSDSEFYSFEYEAGDTDPFIRVVTYTPGVTETGSEMRASLDCFDENLVLLGTTEYRGVVTDRRKNVTMAVFAYFSDIDPLDCVEPHSHSGGPDLCGTMDGLAPVTK